MWLVKNFGIGITLHSGVWGTSIPLPVNLTFVYGKPIKVDKNPNPSNEEIMALLEVYIKELTQLWEETKQYHIPTKKYPGPPKLEIQ